MLEITKENFEEVKKSDKLLLLDFTAEWCPPCKLFAPVLESIAEEFSATISVGKVDVDKDREIASDYQVSAIPTVFLIKNGEIIKKFSGAQPRHILVQEINSNI